jgi:O-Antigen ligase
VTQPRSVTERLIRPDSVPVLIVYVVALLGIPSALIIRPLGAAGTPAQIIGVALFAFWAASRVVMRPAPLRSNPVKWLLFALAAAFLASYVAGMIRPIAYTAEVNSADRTLLSLMAWCGVSLVLIEGVTSLARLETLLRVVAAGVTAIAVLGIIQFTFSLDLTTIIKIPGLVQNHDFGELVARSAYNRVTATTTHPIEFGVVLSAVLPLVIHFARFSETAAQRRRWWIATMLVAIALPLSVARSAAIGGVIAILYLFYTWPGRLQIKAAIVFVVGILGMSMVVPGLLGTIRGLFLNAATDPSTQGRTADYAPVFQYTAERPIFGRGVGTFIPSIYRTLDNAYLATLVEAGIVGLLVLLVLFVGSGCVAGSVRRHSTSPKVRNLGQSLKAGLAVLAVNAATFDAFGFSMCAGVIFLLIGATGALWQIETGQVPVVLKDPRRATRWTAAAATTLVALTGVAALHVMAAKPDYQAYGAVLVSPPLDPHQPPFAYSGDTSRTVSVLQDVMRSDAVRDKLGSTAPDYAVAFGDGSLVVGSDVAGDLSPTLHFAVTAPDVNGANVALRSVMAEARNQLTQMQVRAGVPRTDLLRVDTLQQQPAFPVYGRPTRAKAGLILLLIIATIAFYQLIRRRPLLMLPWRTGGAIPTWSGITSLLPVRRQPVKT